MTTPKNILKQCPLCMGSGEVINTDSIYFYFDNNAGKPAGHTPYHPHPVGPAKSYCPPQTLLHKRASLLMPVILLLFALTLYLTDGRQLYLPNCDVVVVGVVQNDKGVDVPMLYFGKITPDGVEGIGRCPVNQVKGMIMGRQGEEL
jgi:hypothetical protein